MLSWFCQGFASSITFVWPPIPTICFPHLMIFDSFFTYLTSYTQPPEESVPTQYPVVCPHTDIGHCISCVCHFIKQVSNQSRTYDTPQHAMLHHSLEHACHSEFGVHYRHWELLTPPHWSDLCVQTQVIWPSRQISKQRYCVAAEEEGVMSKKSDL